MPELAPVCLCFVASFGFCLGIFYQSQKQNYWCLLKALPGLITPALHKLFGVHKDFPNFLLPKAGHLTMWVLPTCCTPGTVHLVVTHFIIFCFPQYCLTCRQQQWWFNVFLQIINKDRKPLGCKTHLWWDTRSCCVLLVSSDGGLSV